MEVLIMETLSSHFNQWGGVVFFILVYSIVLFFLPFYKKMEKKPAKAYFAFIVAFAIEMHGIPFSMYIISGIIGKKLPNGVLWGHTLFNEIGYAGMYINIILSLIGLGIIINGWYNIYHKYWKKDEGKGQLVTTGIYKYIRHPQYTGLLLITMGMIFEWATLALIIMWPVIFFMYFRLAKKEEKDMLEEFGEEYLMYMDKTKRFIPFVV